ncbi:MAG: hypothetical protein ACRD2I_04700 [Vicinamibacterales bacterium]
MALTRRELLELAAAFAVAPPADAMDRRAADTIRVYSGEGDHRTATTVDRASAGALLIRARATGATASLEGFDLARVDPTAAFVHVGDRRLTGLPMFDGAFTDARGVSGRLGPIGADQPIGWTRIAPNAEGALRKMREESRHAAIVAVTMGGRPGLCPVNAGWFSEPFGPPVLQLSSDDLAAIEAAAAARTEVRVVAAVTRQRAQGFNVVAAVTGERPELAPVCVMTPRSGWHANASERGGGLVCWLETMRAVVDARDPSTFTTARRRRNDDERHPPLLRTVRFVASSGHELGHLGLHDYLSRNPTLARDAHGWVHFGANIGASTGDTGMTASDDGWRDAALRALEPYGLGRIRQSQAAQVAGEAATIKEAGGRFISFIGANAWFHNPGDRWPDAIDVHAVSTFARAVADLTLALANAPA